MDISFRWHLLAASHHGRSGVGRRENIQWLIQSWRMEEGRQIDQEVCGEAGARRLHGTRSALHRRS